MSNIILQVSDTPYARFGDVGWKIPNDGHRYFMVRHEIDFLGYTRHPVGAKSDDGRPAVAHKDGWGTTVSDNKDYHDMSERLEWFFYHFQDAMTGGLLPEGKFIGYYTIKKNPGLQFHDYTPGSLKWLYSRLYQDAVWATDAKNFTGGARDHVLKLNMENDEEWSYLSGRPCTGAVLRLKQDNGSKLVFDCIDINADELPDPYNLEPWQFYFCTQVFPDGRVTRFGHCKQAFLDRGWDYPIGTASPLTSPGGWLEMKKSAVIELRPGDIWTPYKPR